MLDVAYVPLEDLDVLFLFEIVDFVKSS